MEVAVDCCSWLEKSVSVPGGGGKLAGMAGSERVSASPKRESLQIFRWRSHRTDRRDVFVNISILPVWTV